MNRHLSLIRGASADTGIPNNVLPVAGNGSTAIPFHIVPFNTAKLPGTAQRQRSSNQYEIFLLTQGTGIFESGYTRTKIERGYVLYINPGCSFTITASELQGYHISFSAGFISATDVMALPLLFKLRYHSNDAPLMDIVADDAMETLIAVVTSMQKACITSGVRNIDILRGLFFVFMTYLPYASMPVQQSAFCDRLFEYTSHFITLVKAHYHTHKQVTDYARMMCVTPNFLNTVIKKKTGQTASRHIYDTIVQEAKKKAKFTTSSMKEIAYELGFLDIYHFSKFFKKNSGLCFSSFRKEQNGMMLQDIE